MLSLLRLECQQRDFLKSISNSHIFLSFLLIWKRSCAPVFLRIPYPNSDLNRQSLYPISDQNGAKTVSFGAAITYKAIIREYPPPPPGGLYQLFCSLGFILRFCATYRSVHSTQRVKCVDGKFGLLQFVHDYLMDGKKIQ